LDGRGGDLGYGQGGEVGAVVRGEDRRGPGHRLGRGLGRRSGLGRGQCRKHRQGGGNDHAQVSNSTHASGSSESLDGRLESPYGWLHRIEESPGDRDDRGTVPAGSPPPTAAGRLWVGQTRWET